MRVSFLIYGVAITVTLTGCNTSKPESGGVLKAWSESVATLGIRPVYPLQENVFPGNIFLVPTYPGKKQSDEKPAEFYTHYSAPVGSLDLCSLYLSLQNEPELSSISGYKASLAGSSEPKVVETWQPTAIKYSNFKCKDYEGPDFNLNRALSFPAFTFGSVIESGLGANLMAGSVGAKGGVANRGAYELKVSVPSATMIRVDLQSVMTALHRKSYSHAGTDYSVENMVAMMMPFQTLRDGDAIAKPEMLVVTEVYYANAIDVSVTSSASQAAELSLSTQALVERFSRLTELRDKLNLLGSAKDTKTSTGDQAAKEELSKQQAEVDSLKQRINAEQSAIDALTKTLVPDAPGVTGGIKNISTSGVTLTQVLPRPMAFGYRALGLNPEKFIAPQ